MQDEPHPNQKVVALVVFYRVPAWRQCGTGKIGQQSYFESLVDVPVIYNSDCQ
jgi:hypothetical protein